MPPERSERLSILTAVATARAIDDLAAGAAPAPIQIKWPNDIVVNGMKIAGVLIEQDDERALVGIGVNGKQIRWPDDLRGRAISLLQLGVARDRLHVIFALIVRLQYALQLSDEQLIQEFAERDALRGQSASFRSGEREIRGRVLRVDPMQGLAVQTESEGEVWLPAATTTVVKE